MHALHTYVGVSTVFVSVFDLICLGGLGWVGLGWGEVDAKRGGEMGMLGEMLLGKVR